MLLGFLINLFPVIHDMIVFQGNGLNSVILQDGDVGRRSAEEKLVIPLIGRDIGGIREGSFKIHQRHIVVREDIPHVLHDEIDVSALGLQLILEDVFPFPGVSADGKVPRAGDGQDGRAVRIQNFLLFRYDLLDDLLDQQVVLLIVKFREGASRSQQKKGKQQKEQLFHE